jgi:plasmid replication initiation protein
MQSMNQPDLNDDLITSPATLGTTPQYVLQHNAISRSANSLSVTARKIIAMAMALLPADFSSRTVTFTFSEFCEALGYERGGASFKIFCSAISECMDSHISLEVPSKKTGKPVWIKYQWFSFASIQPDTGVVCMVFSDILASVLLELKKVYAKIDLKTLGLFESKYSFRIYETAISYKSMAGQAGNRPGEWYFERSMEQLRKMFDLPEGSYKDNYELKRVTVEKPVKELNSYKTGVSIATTGVKQGRKLSGVRFDCKEAPKAIVAKKPRKKKPLPEQCELTSTLDENDSSYNNKQLQKLKKKYPDEFLDLYTAELMKKSGFPADSEIRRVAAEVTALETLRAKYGIVK